MTAKKNKLRILALVDKGLIPPDHISSLEEKEKSAWRMEYDVVSTLRKMGHSVDCVGIFDDITVMKQAIQEKKPHIVFNMFEQFDGNALFDQHLTSYLELLKVPYTGCNPRGLTLARDKALCKKVLSYHRVPFPQFVVFPKGHKVRRPSKLHFPLFVKSLVEEGSTGISRASIVHDDKKLKERVEFIHDSIGTAAIAEEYIDGRELYVGLLGHHRIRTMPIWELTFDNLPEGAPAIATGRVKWSISHQKKLGVKTGPAKGIENGLKRYIEQISKRIFRALYLSSYARLDFRLSNDNKLYLIEANPNPDLSQSEDFAESARAAGIEYKQLLNKIIQLGLRWVPGADG